MGWFTLDLATPIWLPRQMYISCLSATSFLFFFVASFVIFDILESSLNWFFTLIAFDKKGNAVPMQTRVIFLAWWKQTTPSHSTCKQDDLLFRSFAMIACLLFWFWTVSGPFCQDATWSWFHYITGTTIIYSVHDHDFESPWLWDVNRRNGYISLVIFWVH